MEIQVNKTSKGVSSGDLNKSSFQVQNDFSLTEFFSSESRGPIINRETWINYLTSEKIVKTNTNDDFEESWDEIFEEFITELTNQSTYKL